MPLTNQHMIARRFLSGRSREPLMHFIGKISMTGMAIAVAVLVLVLSVMNGFEREFKQRILGMVPHASIYFVDDFERWQSVAANVSASDGVVEATPFAYSEGMGVKGSFVEPVLLLGLSGDHIVSRYSDFIQGSSKLESGEVILGHRLAGKMGLQLGDRFRFLMREGPESFDPASSNMENSSSNAFSAQRDGVSIASLRIVGLLHSGTELDTSFAITDLQGLSLAKFGNAARIDGLSLRVDDLFEASAIARESVYNANIKARVVDWTRQYGNLYLAIQLSRQMVVVLLAAIVAIAAFNIFVTLGMSVRHREREIAILKTMGMTERQLLQTFLLKGLYIFIPGFIWGAIIGIMLAISAPYIVQFLQVVFAIEFLNTDVYPIDYLPSEIRVIDIISIFGVALIISLLATVVPAWRASRLAPASVLN